MPPSAELIQRVRAWTYRRLRLGDPAPEACEALRDVVAVYSSNPTGPLALASRSVALDPEQLIEMEQDRALVRVPAMRGSIFLTPAETAPRIFAATRTPLDKLTGRLSYAGFDWDDYARFKPRILEHTREPVTTAALKAAIDVDGNLMTLVRLMAYEGLILRISGSLRTDNLRYVATEAWLGRPLDGAGEDESLAWLAAEYLRGYGPARVEDFAWWAGATKCRARAALDAVETCDVGDGLLLPSEQVESFERVEPLDPDEVAILPKWDAYTMGYQGDGRQRLMTDEHRPLAFNKAGDGLPLILRGGRAVATWSHRFQRDRMQVEISTFEPGSLPSGLVESAFDEAGRVLGATDVEITTSGS